LESVLAEQPIPTEESKAIPNGDAASIAIKQSSHMPTDNYSQEDFD